MSDDWIYFVPKSPRHVPSKKETKAALNLLEEMMPDADEVEIVRTEGIQFFNCGGNFQSVACPHCRAALDLDWWGRTMSSDYDEKTGFRLKKRKMPCCSKFLPCFSKFASLDELIYDFHQAFGCFAFSVMNPNIGEMSEDAVKKIEMAMGCEVSIVYKHM
ncbi:hypothetical protein [Tropicibacter oceani]|uniref:Uncharacterized protein n=1 Tax=Tropicibacter oceani TaxID=3058420 RepID=A0ABY8QHD8_9RHOB|nr:hypothetical protein [Tropicibacter oceani]WGW03954.1 hypothetical protein QF118_18880 [Tropicibacter oceani]